MVLRDRGEQAATPSGRSSGMRERRFAWSRAFPAGIPLRMRTALCRDLHLLRESAVRSDTPLEHRAPSHDSSFLCPPCHHLHHILGPHRHRWALVRAQRTQPRVRKASRPRFPEDTSLSPSWAHPLTLGLQLATLQFMPSQRPPYMTSFRSLHLGWGSQETAWVYG